MLTETDLHGLRLGAYVRISTDSQDGGSQNQVSAIDAYCKRHSLGIVDWSTDDCGKNPRGTRNPDFQRMMNDADDGRINGIIVAYSQRLGFLNSRIGQFIGEISDRGVACWDIQLRRDLRECETDPDLCDRVYRDSVRSAKDLQDMGRKQVQRRLNYAPQGRWPGGPPPYGCDLCYYGPDGTFLYRVLDNHSKGDSRKRLKSMPMAARLSTTAKTTQSRKIGTLSFICGLAKMRSG